MLIIFILKAMDSHQRDHNINIEEVIYVTMTSYQSLVKQAVGHSRSSQNSQSSLLLTLLSKAESCLNKGLSHRMFLAHFLPSLLG